MKRLKLFQQKMKEIEDLSAQEDYGAALTLLERFVSKYPFVTRMLIRKGELIQLLPETTELGELSDAQNALEMAVEIDPKSVEALIELAHFYSAVLDRDLEAEKRFDQAIERSREFLEEAYRGKISTLISRGENVAAYQCLQEVQSFFPDSVDIEQSD